MTLHQRLYTSCSYSYLIACVVQTALAPEAALNLWTITHPCELRLIKREQKPERHKQRCGASERLT